LVCGGLRRWGRVKRCTEERSIGTELTDFAGVGRGCWRDGKGYGAVLGDDKFLVVRYGTEVGASLLD
jgi:hypothetical protein